METTDQNINNYKESRYHLIDIQLSFISLATLLQI